MYSLCKMSTHTHRHCACSNHTPYHSVPELFQEMPAVQAIPDLLQDFLSDPKTVKLHSQHRTSVHIAVLVRRGKIISIASNRIGSRSRGAGYSTYSIHAERNVVKMLGDIRLLRGCDLYVMRIPKDKKATEFQSSKPCHSCQVFLEKCMREYGLRNVLYTS